MHIRFQKKARIGSMGWTNKLPQQKVHVSALNMPAITQCKPNQKLKSCNHKI